MPELPEVETVRRMLEPMVRGQKVKDVWSDSKRHLNAPLSKYQKLLAGKKILSVRRRSKLLSIHFEGDLVLAVHLKMTGQLVYIGKRGVVKGGKPLAVKADLPNKHTHFSLKFSSGDVLYFNDIRKFGYAKLFTEVEFSEELSHLGYGPEPLDKGFDANYLSSVFKKYPNRPVKQNLMDQKMIAGIGNIYADEALHGAHIRPDRKSKLLTANEVKRLYISLIKILKKAVEMGGSSISDYINPEGGRGSYSNFHKVYGKGGEPCKECKTILTVIKMGGRSGTFCAKCQS